MLFHRGGRVAAVGDGAVGGLESAARAWVEELRAEADAEAVPDRWVVALA